MYHWYNTNNPHMGNRDKYYIDNYNITITLRRITGLMILMITITVLSTPLILPYDESPFRWFDVWASRWVPTSIAKLHTFGWMPVIAWLPIYIRVYKYTYIYIYTSTQYDMYIHTCNECAYIIFTSIHTSIHTSIYAIYFCLFNFIYRCII